MTDKNAGRRVFITGGTEDEPYKVYTVEPDGRVELLPCRSVTIMVQQNADGTSSAVAMVYFTSPILAVEAKRHADGVRAG